MDKLDWGVAPLPAGPAGQATNVGGEFLAIFKQTKHPRAAGRFEKWMIQPEVQALWSMRAKYLPVRKSVLELATYRTFLQDNPKFRVFVEQMHVARAQRPIDYNGSKIDKILAGAIEKATVGDETAKVVLEEAEARANRLSTSPPNSR